MLLLKSFHVPSMQRRSASRELMDDPSCDKKELLRTLDHFAIINRFFSRSLYLAVNYLISSAIEKVNGELKVLDVGSGGGDFALQLFQWSKRKNVNIHITCLDRDTRIVEYARKKCSGIPSISFITSDIHTSDLAENQFDCVFANHFLHHCTSHEIPLTIARLHSLASCGILINDLRRSPWAYLGFSLFSATLLRSSFAWYDGRLSIRRGFTVDELKRYISDAGLSKALKVSTVLPGRIFIHTLS